MFYYLLFAGVEYFSVNTVVKSIALTSFERIMTETVPVLL